MILHTSHTHHSCCINVKCKQPTCVYLVERTKLTTYVVHTRCAEHQNNLSAMLFPTVKLTPGLYADIFNNLTEDMQQIILASYFTQLGMGEEEDPEVGF